MRSRKYRVVTRLERASNPANPLCAAQGLRAPCVRPAGDDRPPHRAGAAYSGGKRPGRGTFWLAAAHGTQADYARNLQARPWVLVKAGGVWRTGTAVMLPGDDPAARSRMLPFQWDAAIGRLMASAPLTIRIDLDPAPEPKLAMGFDREQVLRRSGQAAVRTRLQPFPSRWLGSRSESY